MAGGDCGFKSKERGVRIKEGGVRIADLGIRISDLKESSHPLKGPVSSQEPVEKA